MEESSQQTDHVSAVFNNQNLVETILEHAKKDIRDNMSFRLVSRTFQDSCHAILRKSHRSVKIEHMYVDSEKVKEKFNENHVFINYHAVKISNVDNYFHLIKTIANVKVDSIYVKNLFELTEDKQKILHDSITRTLIGNDRENIKTLIGMEEICYSGCEDCTQIPQKCLEYGPIRIRNLRESFAEPRIFEKLYLTDYFLDNIAYVCVASSSTKEECLKAVENLVNFNVTCKTLVVKISETRKMEISRMGFTHDRIEPIPREVLEIILKKWKIQSLVLKLVKESHRQKQAGEWTSKEWFSLLRLNGDYRSVKRSSPEFKVSEVCIDLKDSDCCARSLQDCNLFPRYVNKHRYTIVANVRRIFLCDKLSIECSHWGQRLSNPIAEGVRRFMDLITMEDHLNLEVNVRMFATHRNSKEVFEGFIEKQESNSDFYKGFHISTLPSPLPIYHRSFEPIGEHPYHKLQEKQCIGDAFRMINRRQKLTIDWEFMIEKEEPRS